MANKFASGVVLGDLSDFIEPSQACVNPLFASEVNREEPAEGAAKVAVDSSVFSGIPCAAAPCSSATASQLTRAGPPRIAQ